MEVRRIMIAVIDSNLDSSLLAFSNCRHLSHVLPSPQIIAHSPRHPQFAPQSAFFARNPDRRAFSGICPPKILKATDDAVFARIARTVLPAAVPRIERRLDHSERTTGTGEGVPRSTCPDHRIDELRKRFRPWRSRTADARAYNGKRKQCDTKILNHHHFAFNFQEPLHTSFVRISNPLAIRGSGNAVFDPTGSA